MILKKAHRNKFQRGFTLIELMIVISIFAILLGVALPTMRTLVENYGANRAAHELISDMYLARIQAVRTGRNSTIAFNSPAPNQYTITWNNNGLRTRTVDLNSFRGGVRFEPVPPGGPPPVGSIIFTGRGFAQQNPVPGWGDIYLTDREKSKVIRIQTTFPGTVSEQRWRAASNSWTYE